MRRFRNSILCLILFSISQMGYSGKQVIVTRQSTPWMKTVFVDAFYGGLLGAVGYGAYSLIKKDFRGQTLGTAAGVGFLLGAAIGIVDAVTTDSTAFINYDAQNKLYAFSIPAPQFSPSESGRWGGSVRLFNASF